MVSEIIVLVIVSSGGRDRAMIATPSKAVRHSRLELFDGADRSRSPSPGVRKRLKFGEKPFLGALARFRRSNTKDATLFPFPLTIWARYWHTADSRSAHGTGSGVDSAGIGLVLAAALMESETTQLAPANAMQIALAAQVK
jgi:hypothetical protein